MPLKFFLLKSKYTVELYGYEVAEFERWMRNEVVRVKFVGEILKENIRLKYSALES